MIPMRGAGRDHQQAAETAKNWTVVRFPNGSWSYGGSPDSPDYAECMVWVIGAETAKQAVSKARRLFSLEKERAGK